ncbi:hypothetical protein PPTG_14271 [Phytophthora nicotianae INRA-310]|uniref:Elicitin n=1 Tax=Phytophthora nicotianae (strain INRA-310) TaxID=761204 RepID=W2PXD7_PHYN3|nr:hypothetical protein PPTG_14271 [Phytophthora nicotianae INRA-310]ETN05567.1 hypothetical protein PPTG_14271 [Phytophthora nicotianae INRA-310]
MSILGLLAFLVNVLPSVATSSALCNNSELTATLQPLRANVNYSTCQVDANAAAICASSACKSLMAPFATFNLPPCQVSFKGVNFNTFALRDIHTSDCEFPTQSQISTGAMMRTILRLLSLEDTT